MHETSLVTGPYLNEQRQERIITFVDKVILVQVS